jgi:hypothetical protein
VRDRSVLPLPPRCFHLTPRFSEVACELLITSLNSQPSTLFSPKASVPATANRITVGYQMKRVIIVISVFVLSLIGVAVAFFVHADRKYGQPTAELSKMMSVRLITGEALSVYYEQHGHFPRSLSDLPLNTLNWGEEGSTPRDLERWHYSSDGQAFTMTWTNASRGYDLFLGGKGKDIFKGIDKRIFYSREDANEL